MAFTKTPSVSTYDTKRISFISNPLQRSGVEPTKDARLVNMMVEEIALGANNKKYFVKSRPGLESSYSLTAGEAREIFYWEYAGSPYIIAVVGNLVYANASLVGTLTTTTGPVGITEHVSSVAVKSLVIVDGTKGYTLASPASTIVEITAPDFPTPHVPDPIFMDGYIFLAKAGTQDVYNSALDDPTSWASGEYLSAEMYPDTIKALSKNNNYIYAVGSNSVEYMYDVGNSTGTPLARHAAAVQQFGTPAPLSVVQTEKEVILIGSTSNGGYTVWTIDGFKETEIGIPSVKAIFAVEGVALANARAYCIRSAGQKLYIINLSTRTLVYSFDTKMWSEWSSDATTPTTFVGQCATDGSEGKPYLLNKTNGVVYTMNELVHTDNGAPFRCEITTAKEDFDSINRKTMSRFAIIGDSPDYGGSYNTLSVEWSDDDYNTWSTARNLTFTYDFPCITQLGAFRRRAFRIRYTSPRFLRFEGFEVDINKGSQ